MAVPDRARAQLLDALRKSGAGPAPVKGSPAPVFTSLPPEGPSCHLAFNLARVYQMTGRTAEAKAQLEALLGCHPGYAEAHLAGALAAASRGDPGGAVAGARKALEVAPGLADAHAMLGWALTAKGDLKGAHDAFEGLRGLKGGEEGGP